MDKSGGQWITSCVQKICSRHSMHQCLRGKNIRLIQNFIYGYKHEDMKQNLMLVARDNQKKLKKDLTEQQLQIYHEIVGNKYCWLATHFISIVPRKNRFPQKSTFTYCWYSCWKLVFCIYSCLLVVVEWEKLASTPKFEKKCNCGTP